MENPLHMLDVLRQVDQGQNSGADQLTQVELLIAGT